MPTAKAFVGLEFNEALATVRGGPGASAFYALPTPQELHAIYARGFQGVKPGAEESRRKWKEFRASQPRLYDAFPWCKDFGKGKLSTPYTAIGHFDKEWGGRDAQARGDCTVHGTRNGASIDYGCDALMGETKFQGALAVENIYRSRGFNGDGWSCYAPCTYVGPDGKGGLLYRKVYTNGSETVDLSKYNPSWEGNGKAGNPAWLVTESLKNKVKYVIPISTPEEYRDAIAIGFGINVCSGQGFKSSTDAYGLAEASGGWSHSMAHVGCNDTPWAVAKYANMTGLIQNSWGEWNSISGKPEGAPNMATGSFWGRWSVISRMISGDDSFAMCGVWGWERTNWEAFDVSELRIALKSSTVQDYYFERAKAIAEHSQRAVDEKMFLAL